MSTLREVTEDEFFATLKADPRDIMPRIINSTYPYIEEWRNQKSVAEELFGRTEGWPTRYFLVKEG